MSNEFEELINALAADPQFQAEAVMRESLAEAMGPMSDVHRQSMEKVIVQLSRALDEAGMLRVPEGE